MTVTKLQYGCHICPTQCVDFCKGFNLQSAIVHDGLDVQSNLQKDKNHLGNLVKLDESSTICASIISVLVQVVFEQLP